MANKPKIAGEAIYLWQLYIDIRKGIKGDITYSELAAYSDITGDRLTPWEADVILRIDLERLRK